MTATELQTLLAELTALPAETEWVEFKCNNSKPELIGEYISALSNAALLSGKESGYLVWGVEDGTHRIVGTSFRPHQKKVGNELLETWLARLLEPRADLKIHEGEVDGAHVVILEIQAARDRPVAFKGVEWIRVGSSKRKLKDYPEKERALWTKSEQKAFEDGIALSGASGEAVLSLLDYPSYFDLMGRPLPDVRSGILEALEADKLIRKRGQDRFDITNLGAILLAKDLHTFERLERKAVRVIVYEDSSRVKAIHRQEELRGYACGFQGLVGYINDQLPHNEVIEQAVRRQVRMYPQIAIRELVANMLIHQDFSVTGAGPLVEIFSDRIEITNPGEPLIDVRRFLDSPPLSRNEGLASRMRRMNLCEEAGSGIDKVLVAVELHQLPPPDFQAMQGSTRAVMFSPKDNLAKMRPQDRIRACYQHASLRWVTGEPMTNASLRQRFKIDDESYPVASRIIKETLKAEAIKPMDPESRSKKHAAYLPYWA